MSAQISYQLNSMAYYAIHVILYNTSTYRFARPKMAERRKSGSGSLKTEWIERRCGPSSSSSSSTTMHRNVCACVCTHIRTHITLCDKHAHAICGGTSPKSATLSKPFNLHSARKSSGKIVAYQFRACVCVCVFVVATCMHIRVESAVDAAGPDCPPPPPPPLPHTECVCRFIREEEDTHFKSA